MAPDPDTIDPRTLLGAFHTDFWLPRYRAGRSGAWTMQVIAAAATRGYWGQVYPIAGIPLLTGPNQGSTATWMSIVPIEIESQAIGIAAARGHTVVLGLGMGWCAANVALKPEVTRVTVVERDADVIALIEDLGILRQLPVAAAEKIEIVHADAFDWRPHGSVDSLQADIWAKLAGPQRWAEVHRLQATIAPDSLYFWGQEMELWRLACRAAGRVPEALERAELDALVARTGLPLVLSADPALPRNIVEGARWWTPRRDGWWDDGADPPGSAGA